MGFEAGQLVGGRYRLEGSLGRGGMAVVYRARHVGTDKECALKVILEKLAKRKDLVELFHAEAKLGAKIGDHPHIVNVFDAGVDEASGRPFLAMELLVGETLENRLTRGPLTPDDVMRLMAQLALALHQAHSAGVVHRDLKPSNVFLVHGSQGVSLKLMDFGIAKVLSPNSGARPTQTGTVGYAAPEQLGKAIRTFGKKQGIEIAATITGATDVWAMGLLGYEMLTGQSGFQYWDAGPLDELPRRVAVMAPRASERAGARADLLPNGFDAWFARATAKNAAERFQSAVEAAEALARLLAEMTPNPTVRLSVEHGIDPIDSTVPFSEPSPRRAWSQHASITATKRDPVDEVHASVTGRPRDPARLAALYDLLGDDSDRRARVAQVLVVLGAANDEQRTLAQSSLAAPHIHPKQSIPQDRFEMWLRHPLEGPITSDILRAVRRCVAAELAKRAGGANVGLGALPQDSDVAKGIAWAARILSVPLPELHLRPDQGSAFALMPNVPNVPNGVPAVSICSRAFPGSASPRQVAFVAARAVTAVAEDRAMRWLVDDLVVLSDIFIAAVASATKRADLPLSDQGKGWLAHFGKQLSDTENQQLAAACQRFIAAGATTHLGMWSQGAEHTAARAGLLLCDDIAIAATQLAHDRAPRRRELIGDLITFFTSREYRALRETMGLAPPVGG